MLSVTLWQNTRVGVLAHCAFVVLFVTLNTPRSGIRIELENEGKGKRKRGEEREGAIA